MPNFVRKFLKKLNYKPLKNKQLAPHVWTNPIYGENHQFAMPDETSPPLNQEGKTRVQSLVRSFLYYGRVVDNTILPPSMKSLSNKHHQPKIPTKNSDAP